MNREITSTEDFVFTSIAFIILFTLLSELIVLSYSAYNWLKYGVWKIVKLTDYVQFYYIQNNWIGIYKILDTSLVKLIPLVSMLMISILWILMKNE